MKKVLLFTFGIVLVAVILSACTKETKSVISTFQSCENSARFWAENDVYNLIREDSSINKGNAEDDLNRSISSGTYTFKSGKYAGQYINIQSQIIYFLNGYLNTTCGEEELASGKVTTENGYKTGVKYIWDGNEFTGNYDLYLRPAVNWIKNNTEKDAKIFSWWDYGHMIRAITNRQVMLFGPSKELLEVENERTPQFQIPKLKNYEYSEHAMIVDVSTALISTDPAETIKIMNKHNANYLLITIRDKNFVYFFNRFAAGNKTLDENAVIYKALKGNLSGFELGYSDGYAVIYKIKESTT